MSQKYQNLRIDKSENKEALATFKEMGISTAQAVKMFLARVGKTHSIPFPLEYTPNTDTAKTILDARQGKNTVVCKDVKDLFNKLDIQA